MTLLTETMQDAISTLAFSGIIQAAQEKSVPSATSLLEGKKPDHHIFNATITKAQDGSASAGQLHASRYGESGGNVDYTHNKFKVKPSDSDFVIDVQAVARKRLSASQYGYFIRTYFQEYLGIADPSEEVDLTPDGRDKFFVQFLEKWPEHEREQVAEFDRNIRVTLGAAFFELGIYPYEKYMNSGDFDIRMRYEQ